MIISLVVAIANNRVMGRDNALPWHLPADLKYFKRVTMGKPIVMGRKTFEAIGKPLPGRTNVIVTNDANYRADGCTVVHSIEAALCVAKLEDELMIIGGARLFEQVLARADRIYLTEIDEYFTGDTYFPELDKQVWQETGRISYTADEHNPYAYSFVTLERQRQ